MVSSGVHHVVSSCSDVLNWAISSLCWRWCGVSTAVIIFFWDYYISSRNTTVIVPRDSLSS